MMESFLEDAENSLHHRVNTMEGGSGSEESDDPMDDPFLYDKFLPDPDWAKAGRLEEETKQAPLVDPGPFRYNKRIFVTSIPAMLLVLALGGETPVLLVAVGTAVLTLMAQLGDSRRCVIAFVIIFIPCHTYILAAVLPLLWLSLWHGFLVLLVNIYLVLTGGWVLLQFKAFRMEETQLAGVIEMLLFTLYPFVCAALFCWGLGALLSATLLPTIFSMLWFTLLQLYLLPTLSSFRTQNTKDAEESLDIVQVPIVVLTLGTFITTGPFLHGIVSLVVPEAQPIFSLTGLLHFLFIISFTLFLSTLLSIRQIFEYMGFPYSTAIYVRWVSGMACTVLCYPVLHTYGLDSHFLPLLPVAISMFAALGVVLTLKKRKMVMLVLGTVLVVSLVSLFFLWIQRMPHNLQLVRHSFLGVFPINVFYLMICSNLFLCLLCLWAAAQDKRDLLGTLLVLEALVLSVCEVSLHNSQLYSNSLLQLTSLLASYAIHRLQQADKLARHAAILSSSIHLAKSLSSATAVLSSHGEITLVQFLSLGCMMVAVTSVFVYGSASPGESTGAQCAKELGMLLGALAVNGHHFLAPLSSLMFQGSTAPANVIGLWCLLGGGTVLLYSQAVPTKHTVRLLQLALALAALGSLVLAVHPQLTASLWSLFQWMEILSIFTLIAILACHPALASHTTFGLSVLLSICPGIRVSLYLWPEVSPLQSCLCVADVWSLLMLALVCAFVPEMDDTADRVVKYSTGLALGSALVMLLYDILQPPPSDSLSLPTQLLDLPAWWAVLCTCIILAVLLKVLLTTKGPEQLPLTSGDQTVTTVKLSVLTNVVTVLAFLVACTQGPSQPTLHDLWCCAFSMVFGCLHGDRFLLPKLTGERQATPTVMAAAGVLLTSTLLRSRLWGWNSALLFIGGLAEVCLALMTVPIFGVLFGLLWWGKVLSEPAVIFLSPYTFLLLLLSTSYSGWILALATLSAGGWMMLYRLPMVPYLVDSDGLYR